MWIFQFFQSSLHVMFKTRFTSTQRESVANLNSGIKAHGPLIDRLLM